MANISHKDILDPYIHEPKGLSATVGSGKSYITSSPGVASWEYLQAHGLVFSMDFTTPTYTTTTLAAYELINPTTAPYGTSVEFSDTVDAKLTYTGSKARNALLTATLTFKGANNAVYYAAIFKNGVKIDPSEIAVTTVTGDFKTITICGNTAITAGDYFDLRLNALTAAASVHGFSLYATAGA